jgi:hypothetical protein
MFTKSQGEESTASASTVTGAENPFDSPTIHGHVIFGV